jgi:hypothetical protein
MAPGLKIDHGFGGFSWMKINLRKLQIDFHPRSVLARA